MDSLGDIIFFGAIIIAIVSNIAKAIKKKQPKANNRKPDFREIVLDDYDYTPPVVERVKAPVPFLDEEKKIKAKDNRIKEIPTQEIQFYEEERSDFEIDFSEVSEVKKAVIYSEIFNRKY